MTWIWPSVPSADPEPMEFETGIQVAMDAAAGLIPTGIIESDAANM